MEKRPTVHFSNRLEELAHSLGERLFAQGADPFASRIVLLPNHSLKLYLSSFFASHPRWSVCAGITFQTLIEGALSFCQKEKMLSSLALSFAMQQELTLLEKGKWEELDTYLKSSSESLIESKNIWLSLQLSRLFYEYGTFEGKALQKWEGKKGWKQWLWQKAHAYTSFFAEEMPKLPSTFSGQVHLFGFSHIPSHFYEFFCSIGAQIYFLSPSAFFWEDFCSDKERIFLEKKMEGKKVRLQVQEQITFFLKENHPLLANWGKVGRSLVKQLGDTESYLEELYKDPREESSSLLALLQAELLYLEGEKKEISLQDTSILCLSATSKLREVEVLLETLQEYMVSDPDLQPKDILVLCCDLDGYFPYIQMVFGSCNCPIAYSIHGLSLSLAEENAQAMQFFFSLAESRFDRAQILQFFSYPSVMKKFGWTTLEVKEWEDWIEKARVLWGWDPDHKRLCLDQVWPEKAFAGEVTEQGTWEEGLFRLIQGLAMDLDSLSLSPEEIPSSWPLVEVEWTQTELLGKFIQVLFSLKEDLRPVYQKELKTLTEWVFCVQKWIDSYFEKSRAEEALLRDLESFQLEVGEKISIPCSFTSFKRVIEAHFGKKKESFHSSHINSVKFLSMEEGASFPAKVLCALGCDEGSFPRSPPPSCLQDLKQLREMPSVPEQDRYLFLEMLLHARIALICSYQRTSKQDQKEQGPSLLIQDLMNHIDKNFFFSDSSLKPSQVLTRHHPSMNFDQKYFQKEGYKSFSPISFLSAQSYYQENKKIRAPFTCKSSKKLALEMIEIRKLESFIKNPIRFYCQERLGIFFDYVLSEEEEFFLSFPDRAQRKKEALQTGILSAISFAKAKGHLPSGPLGALATCDLKEHLDRWHEHLQSLEILPEEIFCLELSSDAKSIHKRDGKVILPPLCLERVGEPDLLITGKIDFVCNKGLIWTKRADKESLFSLYPSFLILSAIAPLIGIEPKCFLLESGRTLFFPEHDPLKYLHSYIQLYQKGWEEPCWVVQEGAWNFLSKTKEDLQQKKHNSFSSFYDPYEEWLQKREIPLDSHALCGLWKEDWDKTFNLLLQGSWE